MDKKYNIFQSIRLKEGFLKSKLKLLGIEDEFSIDDVYDPSKGYHVLGRVGHSLESFENPTQTILSKADSDERIDAFIQKIKDEIGFMEHQDELFERMRNIYPGFATDMEKKVHPNDWAHYVRVVRQTAHLIKDLTVGSSKRDFSALPKIEVDDVISELIDSQDFSKACNIEDSFMTREFERFREEAEALGYLDENVKNTAVGASIAELVREAEALTSKKERYKANYTKYKTFADNLTTGVVTLKDSDKKGVNRDDE